MSEVAAIIVLGAIAIIAIVVLDGRQGRTIAGEPALSHRHASTRAAPTSSVSGQSSAPAVSPTPSDTAPTPSKDPAPGSTQSAHPHSPAQPVSLEPRRRMRLPGAPANQLAWSEAILAALGAPATKANIESLGYWMQNEAGSPPSGMVGADNPVNVSCRHGRIPGERQLRRNHRGSQGWLGPGSGCPEARVPGLQRWRLQHCA